MELRPFRPNREAVLLYLLLALCVATLVFTTLTFLKR